ncbi:hypothetical protein [Hymenobacter ginkgonis]|nr:hypothetical protein [Hymenobacter ginkgonis]
MTSAWGRARALGPLLALLLAVSLSFWLSPAPQGQPGVDYWGHYARVGPGLGFVVNHDSYGYLAVAEQPGQLLQPQEVRQSRPLYALLGAAAGYPLTAGLRLAGRVGLAPNFWPEVAQFYGFYSGYVLLNALTLLASLLLLRWLWRRITAGRGETWQFYCVAWVLAANPITKTFFWTAHQQMLAFLVPLFCVALAVWLRQRPAPNGSALSCLALVLGLLPLVYGSFVLVWPALAYGLLRPGADADKVGQLVVAPRWPSQLMKIAVSAGLFAVPTLLWVGLLRLHGTTYYNHEAVRYHQLVWLLEARHLPVLAYLKGVASKVLDYLSSFQAMGGWLLLAAGLYAITRWRQPSTGPLVPRSVGPALAWVSGGFGMFFALLGYYPERLTYTLLPLVLCLLAALLPHWPPRYARPAALASAAAWHLYVLLSYGPFS